MKYHDTKEATFLARPNRFIARCRLGDEEVVAHVKNTGRCRELLVPGATVYLVPAARAHRRTAYDLVAVRKGEVLFNIDSSAPNAVFSEFLRAGKLFSDVTLVRPEAVFSKARFDFYIEHGGNPCYIEVKGVTLEQEGVLLFPDAPTERGVKHLREMIHAVASGYEGYIVFIIQTNKAKYFTPNRKMHPEFADTLAECAKKGVQILCFCCRTEPSQLEITEVVPVVL